MSDRNDKDLENNDPASGDSDIPSGRNDKNFPPFDPEQDHDVADEMPAVSITKKKNAVIFIAGFGVLMFLVYSTLDSGPPANTPKTEAQQMIDANRQKSDVPGGSVESDDLVSASAATPGANADGVPALPALEQKSQQYSYQETLPPPPTLPPVFDPASIYVSSSDTGSALGGSPSAVSAFGNRYTKSRSRLPETAADLGDPALAELDPELQKDLSQERQKRIEVSMFVGGSGGGLSGNDDAENADAADGSEDGFVLGETSASKTDVTIRRDLESVILQGKVLDAVLETAINTDLPGKLRGIVSRDVYSESGKRVVIPKGSRLIGSYATDVKFGQARVYVIWTRVIRPDGVDAVLDGNDDLVAIDSLGRSGVYGDLDNRFFEVFGSSILLSSLTVAFAVAADAAAGGDDTTTTTTPAGGTGIPGSSTTSGNVVSQGISEAVANVGSDVSNIAKQYFKTAPRITIDQGTKIKIFVNKDIIFPPSYFSSGAPKTGTQFLN